MAISTPPPTVSSIFRTGKAKYFSLCEGRVCPAPASRRPGICCCCQVRDSFRLPRENRRPEASRKSNYFFLWNFTRTSAFRKWHLRNGKNRVGGACTVLLFLNWPPSVLFFGVLSAFGGPLIFHISYFQNIGFILCRIMFPQSLWMFIINVRVPDYSRTKYVKNMHWYALVGTVQFLQATMFWLESNLCWCSGSPKIC